MLRRRARRPARRPLDVVVLQALKRGRPCADYRRMTVLGELARSEPVEPAPQRRRFRWPYAITLLVVLVIAAIAIALPYYDSYVRESQRQDAARFTAMVASMPAPAGTQDDFTHSSCAMVSVRCFESTGPDRPSTLATVCTALAGLGASMDCGAVEWPGLMWQVHGTYGRAEVVATAPDGVFNDPSLWEPRAAVAVAVFADVDDTRLAKPASPGGSWLLPTDLTELQLLPNAWSVEARCTDPAPDGCRKLESDQHLQISPTQAAQRLARGLEEKGLRVDGVRCMGTSARCTVTAAGFRGPAGTKPILIVASISRAGDGARLLLIVSPG